MEQNSNAVTVSDTQDAISDRFEVETNITAEPEVEPVKEDKPEPKPAPDSDATPSEDSPESKTINPRTQARKAEKERLLRENADYAEKIRQQDAELAKYKQPQKPEGKQPKDLSKEPDIQDYDDAIEYTRDVAKYEATQAFKQETSKLKQQEQVEALTERAEIFKADKPDFDEKVGALYNSGLITPDIDNAILASKMGEQLSYHLAQFGGDLMALRGLPKELLPNAIKEIESFIKKGGDKQEKPRVTQASPPITPPGHLGKSDRSLSSYTQQEIEEMPLSEYRARFIKK